MAARLNLDKSTVSRRLSVAGEGGWLTNNEERRGHPGRWLPGDPLPDEIPVLPTVARLRTEVSAGATAEEDKSAAQ